MKYLLAGLFLFSGMTALLFEIVWVRWFTVLFGSTETAAAAVLCAFFLGMALGHAWFGKRADQSLNPALDYGVLVAGVGLGAVYVAVMFQLFRLVYPLLYGMLSPVPGMLTAAKLWFAVVAVSPVTFLMGGTLPMVTRGVTPRRRGLGALAGSAYALNTLGAVAGAVLAGFFLPVAIGVRNMALAGMAVNGMIFAIVLVFRNAFARSREERESRPTATEKMRQAAAKAEAKPQTDVAEWPEDSAGLTVALADEVPTGTSAASTGDARVRSSTGRRRRRSSGSSDHATEGRGKSTGSRKQSKATRRSKGKATSSRKSTSHRRTKGRRPDSPLASPLMVVIAAVSGVCTLAIQVLWLRLFSLFFPNTVYNLAAVLAVFLFGLSIGAGLAAVAFKLVANPGWVLACALIAAGLGVLVSPELFFLFPDYKSFGAMASWHTLQQAAECLVTVGGTVLPAVIPAGLVLPLTWKIYGSANPRRKAGRTVGLLTAFNTGGVVVGTILAGFILVPLAGLSVSIQIVAWVYLITAAATVWILLKNVVLKGALLTLAFALIVVAYVFGFPLFSPFFMLPGIEAVATFEGRSAHVAIAEMDDDRFILVNNFIKEGGTADVDSQRLQGHLPLLLHPNPRSVAFIGLGTGITAGASTLHEGIERIVGIEISRDILRALPFFAEQNRSFQNDPRVELVRDDGRNYLFGARERFDVIVCDLVQPFNAGAGYLFTLEHYRTMKRRLNEGGVYAHWLPMHQLSQRDFESIARTFRTVFPDATVWRGPIAHERSNILALVGTNGRRLNIDKDFLVSTVRGLSEAIRNDCTHTFSPQMLGLLFAGELPDHPDFFRRAPLNLDDRPRLEFSAPLAVQYRRRFTDIALYQFYHSLFIRNVSHSDSLFANSMELRLLNELSLLIQKMHFPELVTEQDKRDLQELTRILGMDLAGR